MLSETSGEAVYRRLRGDIVFARLEPGRRLRLEQLRQEYEVSVATLREVMPRLVAEGLLNFETHRGFEVAPVSVQDLSEIADMRILLECHGLAKSFARGDLEWEAGVVAAHHKLARMEARMLAGDRSVSETWKRYDREFHRALIGACGSDELLDAYDRIFDRFLRYQVLLVMFRGKTATDEHHALLESALERDTRRADGILRRHIGACIEYTAQNGLLEAAQ